MSQIHVPAESEPPPPSVATTYQTDNGNAVPAANILIMHGTQSSINNNSGIIINGGTPATAAGNEVDIVLTNRVTGQVTTIDATPTVISTFALSATPGCYTIDGVLTGYNVSGNGGIGVFFAAAIKTDGATATVIGSSNTSEFKDNAAWDLTVSASTNNLIVTVIGSATTLDWDVCYNYRFVS